MSVRRCGVQRRPRARSWSRTSAQSGRRCRSDSIRSGSSSESIDEKTRPRPDATRCDIAPRPLRFPSATRTPPMFDIIAAAVNTAAPVADIGILLTGLLLGHPPRHRLGPHRGDHRHHQHDRCCRHGRGRPRRPARDACRARTTATAASREIRVHDAGPGAAIGVAGDRHATVGRAGPCPVRPGRRDPARDAVRPRSRRGRHRPGPRGDRVRCAPPRLARPDHGPDRRVHPGRPRAVGPLLRLSLRAAPASRSGCAAAGCWCSTGSATAGALLQARLHGHEHVEPLEMSSYGAGTSFGVGMIHGIGAETGTQVLLIAAVGGASSAGLGVPMLFAFVVGLLLSNFAIVLISSVGFVSSQSRERIYVGDRRGRRASSACSSGRSSCSAWTASCRTSGPSCPSSPAARLPGPTPILTAISRPSP